MSGNWRLLVHIYSGKGTWVGADDGLIISGSFNEETKLTPLVFPEGNPVWNTELSWTIDSEQKRKLDKSGISQCKLTVLTRGGHKYGYFVLDLRSGKMNFSSKDPESIGKGEWCTLAGAGKSSSPPEVRAFHSFGEVPLPRSPPPEMQVEAMFASKRAEDQSLRSSAAVSFADDFEAESDEGGNAEASSSRKGAGGDPEGGAAPGGSSAQEALKGNGKQHHADEEEPQTSLLAEETDGVRTSYASIASEVPRGPTPFSEADPARKFRLVLDVRSFRALRKMPLTVANTVVRVLLPPELSVVMVGSGKVSSALGAPIRTHPPVEIARGNECSLPNGSASLEFTSTVMAMATALAGAPRLTAEVWHRDKFTADALVGMASVPMEGLLQEPWVDGYAPVVAAEQGKKGRAGAGGGKDKVQVQVGALRMVMSLEEFGEVHVAPMAKMVTPAASVNSLRSSADPAPRADPPPGPAAPAGGTHGGGGEARAVASGSGGGGGMSEAAQGQVDYEMAWELEVWRQAEEARWKAEQKEREVERMAALEGEWRRRERVRESEMCTHRAEAEALEDRLRAKLIALEDRERKLVGAEESLARRRKDLEREMGLRTTEAQQAVRRLQQECEHQLEMERERTCELLRQKSALEEKLALAEGRVEAVEAAFHEYRAAQRLSPEAQLQAQVAALQAQAADAERRAEGALRSKREYKDQVVKLAQELARLKQRHEREEAARLARDRRHVDALSVQAAAEGEAKRAKEEQEELGALRAQLSRLQAGAEAGGGAGAAGAAVVPPLDLAQVAARSPPPGGDGPGSETRRLLHERAALLRTGLYTKDDRIIVGLDQQLAALSSPSAGG